VLIPKSKVFIVDSSLSLTIMLGRPGFIHPAF
jgi:hypothetical protein